ncbi:hypothetical protein A8C56_22845 [Niabella ginsenosidivorans]|uniref:DUF5689 domain-containing protein n=1 Tax=Niabella ginsenosidivorans TaxID=1176587 RepID=A0A1A9I6Y6_9BACT|nr:DUF5689 domain-containing protein [Niabella ginsenosidivorans]ANH83438.1 hypothetical protein A8C56_22845 [Niabella ginsenosidivorans]
MKNYPSTWNNRISQLLIVLLLITACNKKFDAPPINTDPDVAVDMTIAELKSRYQGVGIFQTITEDKTITGIVTADDRSGNFFKQIVIQDETGAIPVLLDGNSVYTSYPIGRRVFVKLKGMMLGDYGGTIQLGLDSTRSDAGYLNVGRIPMAQFDQFIIKGSYGNTVTPMIITPADLSTNITNRLQSMLVQFDHFQFADGDTSKTYADPEKKISAVNFTIRNCEKKTMVLRNSSYASFAALKLPKGNGSIVGINSIFNGTQQLLIRDTGDVHFNEPRCGTGPLVPKTIAALRQLYQGAAVEMDRYAVGGTVISDPASKNTASGTILLQSGNRGIAVYFGGSVTYHIGDSVVLNLSDADSLISYRGSLELKLNKDFVKLTPVATGRKVTPVVKTINAVNSMLDLPPGDPGNFESTLITIEQASAAPGTFSGSHALTDATGSIELYTQTGATFALQTIPTGAQSWTGYAGNFNTTKQFSIRNTNDVTGFEPSTFFSALFDFKEVTDSTGTTDPTALPVVSNLVFTPFKAVGVGTKPTASGRFSFSSWPTGATDASEIFSGKPDEGKYYEVTITPSAGSGMDLFSIAFTLRRSGTGIRQAVVRSSIDNFKENLPVSVDPGNKNMRIVPENIFQVNDASTSANEGCVVKPGAAFMNLKVPVTFRFYGFNAESAAGTFSIDDVRIGGSIR